MNNRIQRINSLLKEELSKILSRELDFSRDVLVTITRCETFSNLSEAKVYISVLPEEKRKETFEIINKKIFDIQQILNSRLKMRPIPKIRFVREEKNKQAQRIEEILDNLKKQ